MKYLSYKLPLVFSVEKLVMVHYLELSKHAQFPPETHDFWEFHYVDKGSVISISDGERIQLNHGEILFHKPMSEHQLITDGAVAPNVCVVSFYCKPSDIPFLEKKKLHLNAKERETIRKFINEVIDSSVSNANNKNIENLKEAFIDLGYEIEELQEACSANDDEAIKENLATLFKAYEMLNKHISIIKL